MRQLVKTFLFSFSTILVSFALKAENPLFIPSVNTNAVSSVTEATAISGGNGIILDGGVLVDKGIVWAKYSASDDPVVLTDSVRSAGASSSSDFLMNLENLDPESRYEVRAYIVVDSDTLYGNTISFYSLSESPLDQDVNFSASSTGPTSIAITFDNPSSTGADGYILLRRENGVYPNLTGIQNGEDIPGAFPAGTTFVALLTDGNSPYSDTGLDPNQQYHYSIIPYNSDGLNASTYHYIYNATHHSDNATTDAAEASDLVSGGNEAGDIFYANYTASTVNNTSDALRVWRITLRDGGGSNDNDGLATTLTNLTLTPGTGNSVSNWEDAINRAVLFVGGTKRGETTPSGNSLAFSGLTINAAQNSNTNIDLYLTFNDDEGGVTDNQRFVFSVSSATVSSGGSQLTSLGTVNSQNAATANKLEVVAQTFELSNYPAQVDSGAVFSLDVEAVDNNGNKDINAVTSISLTADNASVTSATGLTQNLVAGEYGWSDIRLHPSQTSSINVEISGGGLTARSFEILVYVAGVVVVRPDTLIFCTQNSILPLGDIRIVEGSVGDFEIGNNLWYTIALPNGYRFVDLSTDDVSFSSASDLSDFDRRAFTNGDRRYNFRFDVTGTAELDTIYVSGLQVEKTGTGSDTLEINREFTGAIPGETTIVNAVQFKNSPNEQVHGMVLSTSVENIILNSNRGSGPICEGTEVIFTAYGANTYEFFVNNVLQASSGSTFTTSALQNNNIVKVKGYIGACVDSAQITMSVQAIPTINITSPNYGTIDQNNPNPIQISSDVVELNASPVGGIFSGTGVKKIGNTNFFDPEEAGVGVHAVRYDVTSGVCTVLDSIRFSVESPSGGGFTYFSGLEAKYCEDDDRSLLTWPYDPTTFPVIRYNGPGVVEDPVGSGNWYFDPNLALEASGPGLTSVYVTYGYSFIPGMEFNLPPQTTFVYARPSVSFSVTHNGDNKSLPEYFCGNEQSVPLIGSPVGTFENGKIYFTLSDLDNAVTDTIDANDPKAFSPIDVTASIPRNFAITYNYTAQVSGCFNSFSDTTTVLPVPRAVDNSDIQDKFYCEGEPLEFLNVNSGSEHLARWFDRDNSTVISELDSIFPTIFTTGQKQYEAAFVTNELLTCQGAKKIVTVTVNPKPNLTLDGLNNTGYCIDNQNPVTTTPRVNGVAPPLPANVVFRWMRIEPDTLDYGVFTQNPVPSDYPEGSYIVSYSYTDHNNCSNILNQPTRINPLPLVDFSGLDSMYCADAGSAVLAHNISSGDNPLNNSNLIYEINKNSQGNFVNLGVRVFDPQSILAGVGQHQIRLTYTDNRGCSNDTVKNVEVLPLPRSGFTVDEFCLGAPTIFADSSFVLPSVAGDSIVSYGWYFGDGDLLSPSSGAVGNMHNGRTTGTFSNPYHEYQNNDDFTVTHLVETIRGCTHSVVKNIVIGAPPKANFSAIGFCEGDDVRFTDLSTVDNGAVVRWEWEFGDGSTGDLRNPSHFYSGNGRFPVMLKIYSNLQCVDSLEKEIIKFSQISATSLPYSDDFDGSMQEWMVNGENPSWRSNTPDGLRVPLHDGAAWVTQNPDTTYNNLENSYVESPCFDLTTLDRPVVNLDLFRDLETDVDGAVLQMTFNDGTSWHVVGDDASGANWFNSKGLPSNPGMQTTGINYGWTSTAEEWVGAKYALDTYVDTISAQSRVRFRVALGSNLTNPGNAKFGGFAFDNFHIGSRNRKILLEHFTNSNTTGYTTSITELSDFVQDKDEELIHLVYHNSYPVADDVFSFNPEDLETRSFFYGISEGPASVMDGYLNSQPFGQWGLKFYNNETLQPSPYELAVTNNSANGDNRLRLDVEVISGITGSDTFNIYIALAEEINGLYIVREMLPEPYGERVERTWTIGESAVFNFDLRTKSYPDPDNMYLIGFLQNPKSNAIYQSFIASAGNLPQIITGINEGTYDQEIVIYPNPFLNELTIFEKGFRKDETQLKIFNEQGVQVFERNLKPDNSNLLDLGILKSGVYIIRLSNKDSVEYRKIVKL